MDLTFAQWPVLSRLLWTAVTVAVTCGLGFVINAVVFRKLTHLAKKTESDWDDVVVEELRRRITLWSLLVGLWLSLGYWPMPATWRWFANNVIKTVAVASVTLAAAAIATRLIVIFGPRAVPGAPVSGLVRNIVRMVIFAVGMLIILNGLGVNITPALAALGVGGLAVALALQDPLSNLFAGVFVALARQIRIGDYVRLDSGAEGHIQDFNWHSTRIQSPAGNLVIVPNAKVSQAIVTNFSLPSREVGVNVDITVNVANDVATLERVTTDVARQVMKEVTGGVPEFEPSIRLSALSDLGIRCSVALRARDFTDQLLVRHEFLKRLQVRFKEEGILLSLRHRAEPEDRL
jgi:small-conductance mechanosensitive channel